MFSEERAPERPFLAKSDQSSEEQHSLSPGTCLAKNRRRKEGRGKERKNRGSMSWCEGGKTQLPLCLSPVLLLKEWEGGEGASEQRDCWHHLYMSFVFQPSSLHRARLVCSVFK